MARGTVSKTKVTNEILKMFKGSFESNKKIYIPMVENGENLQIAISLTCPKGLVDSSTTTMNFGNGHNFDDDDVVPAKTEITEDEIKNIENLMEKLGL